MTDDYSKIVHDICVEKHKRLDEKIINLEIDIGRHDKVIEELQDFKSGTVVEIKNLCKSIDNLAKNTDGLIKSVKNTVATLVLMFLGTLLSFFVWYVQTK